MKKKEYLISTEVLLKVAAMVDDPSPFLDEVKRREQEETDFEKPEHL